MSHQINVLTGSLPRSPHFELQPTTSLQNLTFHAPSQVSEVANPILNGPFNDSLDYLNNNRSSFPLTEHFYSQWSSDEVRHQPTVQSWIEFTDPFLARESNTSLSSHPLPLQQYTNPTSNELVTSRDRNETQFENMSSKKKQKPSNNPSSSSSAAQNGQLDINSFPPTVPSSSSSSSWNAVDIQSLASSSRRAPFLGSSGPSRPTTQNERNIKPVRNLARAPASERSPASDQPQQNEANSATEISHLSYQNRDWIPFKYGNTVLAPNPSRNGMLDLGVMICVDRNTNLVPLNTPEEHIEYMMIAFSSDSRRGNPAVSVHRSLIF